MSTPKPSQANLHGNVPDKSEVVLLLIDVINDLDFKGNASLLRHSSVMADRIAALKTRMRRHGFVSIYVNDNFGKWQSDFAALVSHCLKPSVPGRHLAERLKPASDDYFVLKPKHSGFYGTTLHLLLQTLRARILVLAGISADRCVLFTANDAYLRDYKISIPSDCVVANSPADKKQALNLMRRVLKADVSPSGRLTFVRPRQ